MEGDLVAANSDRAMYVGNVDDMTITNATIAGNQPVVLNTASVRIDSSIFDTPIDSSGGTVACEITHSRGPAIIEGGEMSLLGQSFLARMGKIEIENDKMVIR